MRQTDNYETPVCTEMACLSPFPVSLRSCQPSCTYPHTVLKDLAAPAEIAGKLFF